MPKKKRTKYTLRSDGRIQFAKMYNGKRKFFYGDTDEEVDAKIAAYENSNIAKGIILAKDVSSKWWEETYEALSVNSVRNYRTAYNRFNDEFGDMDVSEITMQDCIRYIQMFALRGYAQKTVNNMKSVMMSIFNYGLLHNLIERNPAAGMPEIKGKKAQVRMPASDSDIRLVNDLKHEMPYGTMLYVMLFTGLRRGEAIALQQKDVDMDNKLIHVRSSAAYGGFTHAQIKEPKTANGIRTIPLLDNVIEVLPHYDSPETYIFFPAGLPTRADLENGLMRFCRDNHIESTAHQFRHSFATLLHDADIDAKDAQSILGHAQITTTLDIYTHINQNRKAVVGSKLNSFVNHENDCE